MAGHYGYVQWRWCQQNLGQWWFHRKKWVFWTWWVEAWQEGDACGEMKARCGSSAFVTSAIALCLTFYYYYPKANITALIPAHKSISITLTSTSKLFVSAWVLIISLILIRRRCRCPRFTSNETSPTSSERSRRIAKFVQKSSVSGAGSTSASAACGLCARTAAAKRSRSLS